MFKRVMEDVESEVDASKLDRNSIGRAIFCCDELNRLSEGQNFRVVIGSLGIGKGTNLFYEYGGPSYKSKEQFAPDPRKIEAYGWIEDSDGKIYDKVTSYLIEVAWCRSLVLDYKAPVLLEGCRKEDLRRTGLVHLETTQENQDYVIQQFLIGCH